MFIIVKSEFRSILTFIIFASGFSIYFYNRSCISEIEYCFI